MPTPTSSLSTLRPDLASSLEEFDLVADRGGFIGLEVLPVIEIQLQSGTFGVIPREELLRSPQVERTSRGSYNEIEWEFEEATFATRERGLMGRVDDRDAAMYGNFFDAEVVTAGIVRDGVLRAQEVRVKDLLWNTSTWTGSTLTTAATAAWTMALKATSVPIDDVEAAVRKVWVLTGMWPNALIIGNHTFRNLTHTAQVIDRIVSEGAGNPAKPSDITSGMLSAVFKLPKIIVARSALNSAREGQAISIAPLWSNDYAMVARVAETSNIKEPCLGRTFHWGADGSSIGGTFETFYSTERRGDVVRLRHDVQEKVLMAEMAHLITNTNSGNAA